MTAQENLNLLISKLSTEEHLLDRIETSIFMNNDFASYLEMEMNIKDIKASGVAGYRVSIGPFNTLYAYNRSKNVMIEVSYQYRRLSDDHL